MMQRSYSNRKAARDALLEKSADTLIYFFYPNSLH